MPLNIKSRRMGCLIPLGVILVAFIGLYLAAAVFPGVGAQGADFLRKVIGDEATAQLEMFIFQAQDTVNQVKFSLGIDKAEAPWQAAQATLPATPSPTPAPPTTTPTPEFTPTPTPTPESTYTPQPPTATPTATPWAPAGATALGSLDGEAVWTPYLQDAGGKTVAFRTFIQPDPKRPYTLVAVVAFDLSRTRLNFVLGSDEPKPKETALPRRSGTIPTSELSASQVIATFNGGFKGEHGSYGAMASGLTALPPRDGFATVAMFANGEVKIGSWGKDIQPSSSIVAWRQNCHLIIQEGQMNPLVKVDTAEYWGANLNGATVTWRSGIGISPDGKTLYYFAGPSMMASILAQAMMAVGVQSGMQLDINSYWVHFAAVKNDGKKVVPEPLFPEEMKFNPDRYLIPHQRDFFYISLKTGN